MEFLQQNWYWAALAVVSGGWLLVETLRSRGDKSSISPVEATLLINREDAVVIDVRDQGEYAQGHIPNARHLPLGDIARRSGELEKFKSRPIVVSDRTGARAASVTGVLRKNGFGEAVALRGGVTAWQQANLPLEKA